MEPLEQRHLLATLIVNSVSDVSLAGDGLVTLREAVLAANSDMATDLGDIGSGDDSIVFHPTLTGTIALGFGGINVTDTLTISGPGAEILTIDARNSSSIFLCVFRGPSRSVERHLLVVTHRTLCAAALLTHRVLNSASL
jgi:hypothetical protein